MSARTSTRLTIKLHWIVIASSWLEFNVPFHHKYGYIRDERSGVESYPYPVNEGQRYINLIPGCLYLFILMVHINIKKHDMTQI